MNILFLEPFYYGSNKSFLEGLRTHSTHSIFPLTVIPAEKDWKSVGLSQTLARRTSSIPDQFDLIIASSQTNLTGFLALTRARFARTPTIVYMHENRFTEPLKEGKERNQATVYASYLSLLAADRVVFNSEHHRNQFFEVLPAFFPLFPELQADIAMSELQNKSSVIHPGLSLTRHDSVSDNRTSNRVPVIMWNQRWDYEKDPAKFFRMMNRLDDAGFRFELILAGDKRETPPPEFERAMQRYGQRVLHIGFVEDFQSYSKLLHTADFVVSTARHEFFPGSILEAVYCGCHPFLPYDLTYPELLPPGMKKPLLHAQVFYSNEDELFEHIRTVLRGEKRALPKSTLVNAVRSFDWSKQIAKFDRFFEATVSAD